MRRRAAKVILADAGDYSQGAVYVASIRARTR